MFYYISGKDLDKWRKDAYTKAILHQIPTDEVDWLLKELTNLDKLSLRLNNFQNQSQIQIEISPAKLAQLWQQRIEERIPVQYLIGRCHWRNFTLKVSPDVLIPRPETELIIDLAKDAAKKSHNSLLSKGNWVDLGTGSGAIALGLADIFPDANIYSVDISKQALAIAQENAIKLNFAPRINFYQGSWWNPLEFLKGKVSGMVSNPPYIPSKLINDLQVEVVKHEPHLALDGGEDGLNDIRYLIKTAPFYLVSGGVWLIEIMDGQAELVVNLLKQEECYQNIEIIPDLAGIERFVLSFID